MSDTGKPYGPKRLPTREKAQELVATYTSGLTEAQQALVVDHILSTNDCVLHAVHLVVGRKCHCAPCLKERNRMALPLETVILLDYTSLSDEELMAPEERSTRYSADLLEKQLATLTGGPALSAEEAESLRIYNLNLKAWFAEFDRRFPESYKPNK